MERGEHILRQHYPVVTNIQVRFRDLDAMGHVNNAVYLTYLEMARVAYYTTLMGPRISPRDFNFILAHVEIDFRSPIHLDETVYIGIRLTRIGRTSFHFAYELREGESGRLLAEATSVQVLYDYERQRPIEIPPEFIQRVNALEKKTAS